MITVFTSELTNRLRYIFELFFEELLQVPVLFVTTAREFEQAQGARLNYSNREFSFCQLNLRPHALLFQKELCYQDLTAISCNDELCFLKSCGDSFLPFDPFAAGFFLVSRYEEYLERQFGKHRRYPPHHSVLHRNKLLHRPVVNEWALLLAQKVQSYYPEFRYQQPAFNFLTTIDVDNAWAYKNKSWPRMAGATLKALLNGNYESNRDRFRVLAGKKEDPYDTYSYIRRVYRHENEHLRFFFLLGRPGRYDRNVSPRNENYRQLIRDLAGEFPVGIHPSYRSSMIKSELRREINLLKDITGETVDASRQHFLRLELPKTYRRLLKAGIKADYTMGYAECLGFRAGIASPFYFYDLKFEERTSLRVIPFQGMDVTLKDYLKLSPGLALDEIRKLMLEVKKYGGTFVSIWHNESLSDQGDWAGWRQVFEEMTALAISLKDGSE
ncbi:MAG: polysaccharide deacetylase family protein [Mangrovibacterium sp.]